MKKRYLFSGAAVLVIALIIGIIAVSHPVKAEFPMIANANVTIYEGSSCGCCGLYAGYFKDRGNKNIIIKKVQNNTAFMQTLGVPLSMESCHTLTINGYVVEGHVPLEVIEKLLEEKPDIKGIAMPGMPNGSPGMPGNKEPFKIYKINNDRSTALWMEM